MGRVLVDEGIEGIGGIGVNAVSAQSCFMPDSARSLPGSSLSASS
jgi:hypothetical protein